MMLNQLTSHYGMRLWVSFALLPAMLLLSGCGSNELKLVPVSGKVTLDGGAMPGPGTVYFNPESASPSGALRPATAEFDADGNYTAKSFTPGDGLLPGKYVIRVDCWKQAPNMESKPVVSFLPQKYQEPSKSGLTLTVEPDAKSITHNIDLQSK